MGKLQITAVATCAAAFLAPSLAQAGGTFRFPPEPVVAVPSAIAVPSYPSWYLRGDIGWGLNEDPEMSRGGNTFTGVDMDDSIVFGAGFGYIFSDNIRGDITVDYRDEADLTANNTGTGLTEEYGISSTVILGNVYYDFRGRDDFTPYAGVGLGMAINEPGNDDHRFDLAAAAMAGITYRIGSDWMVDAGYRFLYLGEARSEGAGAVGNTNFDDLMAHEIRFGLRYEFE